MVEGLVHEQMTFWCVCVCVCVYIYIYITNPNACWREGTIKFGRDYNPMTFLPGCIVHQVNDSFIFTSAFQQTSRRHQCVGVNTSDNRFVYMDVLDLLLCEVSIAGKWNPWWP